MIDKITKSKEPLFICGERDGYKGVFRKSKKLKFKLPVLSGKSGMLVLGVDGTKTNEFLLNYAHRLLNEEKKVIFITHSEASVKTLESYIIKTKVFCPSFGKATLRDLMYKKNYSENAEIISCLTDFNPQSGGDYILNQVKNALEGIKENITEPSDVTIMIENCICNELSSELKILLTELKQVGFGLVISSNTPLLFKDISNEFDYQILFNQMDSNTELESYQIIESHPQDVSLLNRQDPDSYFVYEVSKKRMTKEIKFSYC